MLGQKVGIVVVQFFVAQLVRGPCVALIVCNDTMIKACHPVPGPEVHLPDARALVPSLSQTLHQHRTILWYPAIIIIPLPVGVGVLARD